MKMNFLVLSKFLSSTQWMLISAYIGFVSTLFIAQHSLLDATLQCIIISLSLILCMFHHYVSFRVKFDADLLLHLAQKSDQNGTDIAELTQSLDQSLLYFKLIPHDKTGRGWELRFNGCLKLFKIQIMLLISQWALFLIMTYTQFMS